MTNQISPSDFIAMPSEYNRKVSVFLIERQELSRTGYRLIFERDDKLEIIGEGEDLELCLDRLEETKPQVLVLRAENSESDVRSVQELKTKHPDVHILILTDNVEASLIAKFISAGASGCCSRNVNVENLLVAVRSVAAGGMWFGPVASTIIRGVMNGEVRLPSQFLAAGENGTVPASLTDRESEILKRVAQGLTNQQIAERLHLSVETVKTYIRRIMDKSSIRSRRELVACYRRNGSYKF